MTFEERGNVLGKTLMLLPGTCCDWQTIFSGRIDGALGSSLPVLKAIDEFMEI